MSILNMTGGGASGPKIPLNDISTLSTEAGIGKATLKWTDVGDLVVNGVTANSWNSTKLVRKVGSTPSNSSDGTLVTIETTLNQYQTNGYTDTGLTSGTTYYYKAFSVGSNGLESGSNSVSVVPSGWQPGANTIAYFPFESDGLDVMGNYTLSNTGTQESIGRSFTSTSSLNSVPSGCRTVVAWLYLTSYTSSGITGQSILLRGTAYNANILVATPSSIQSRLPAFYMYYNNQEYIAGNNVLPTGQRCLVTISASNDGIIGYVNDTPYTLYTGSYPGAASESFLLFVSGNNNMNVTLSNVIFEDKARTAQEVSNYYNFTKSTYGL